MSLYDDEALKQEVIYLHSLWFQGPPTRNPNPYPNSNPNPVFDPIQRPRPNYIPPADLHLPSRYGPVTVRSHLTSRNPNFPHHLYKRPRADPGPEWPAMEAPPSPPAASGWREFRSNPCKKPRPVPPEELAKLAARKLQRDVLQTCRQFLAGKSGEDGSLGGRDEAEDGDGDEDQSSDKVGPSAEFEFFRRMFDENGELKEYYEKNAGNGEIWCLVCGGGEKSVRKFKSCLALVQHSLTIHKTDMKTAHRAFAKVVCNVLGWDVNNPVASSQKDTQVAGEGPNVESQPECSSNPKKPEEKQVMSAEEQAWTASLQMQQKVSEACRDFYAENACSIDETETEEEHDDVDDSLSEEFKFFSSVFFENDELKKYYGNNYEDGDFICLVCAGIGKKGLKRFKGCFSLLRHSIQGQNTKKRAHRSFARITCKLLGWDFDRLPFAVAKGGDPHVGSNNVSPSAINEEHFIQGTADPPPNNNEAGSGSGV